MTAFLPTVLVLGPGGVKGFLELGTLFALYKNGHLDKVVTHVGVSIGSIISLLLICGYNVREIITHALDTELFQDIKTLKITDITNGSGLFSNDIIKKKLGTLVTDKYGFVPTLQELYQFTGKTLVCVTNNLTKRRMEYMSHLTEPTLSCVDAVMFSMNIPGILFKITYKDSVYCDGALGDPYPIELFDDGKTDILGIYIEDNSGVTSSSSSLSYLNQAIFSPLLHLRRRSIAASSKRCRHIALNSNIVDTTGFSVSTENKANMIINGFVIAQEYLLSLNKDSKHSAAQASSTNNLVDMSQSFISDTISSSSVPSSVPPTTTTPVPSSVPPTTMASVPPTTASVPPTMASVPVPPTMASVPPTMASVPSTTTPVPPTMASVPPTMASVPVPPTETTTPVPTTIP